MTIEINRLKAMIELRKIDDLIAKQKNEGKTDWSQQEIDEIEEKRNDLNAIIKNGKGVYQWELLPDIE